MRIIPKIKFQTKLFISNIFLTLLACTLLGFSVSKVSSEIYLDMFLNNKKELMMNISDLIDGDIHGRFFQESVSNDPAYLKLLGQMKNISQREKYVTWIYSLNYLKETDDFVYSIDPSLADFDTIWVESKWFGFEIYRNKMGRLIVRWNDIEFNNKFKMKYMDVESSVRIEQGEIAKIYVNDILILNISSGNEIQGYIYNYKIDKTIDHVLVEKEFSEDIPYIRLSFSEAGMPSSTPGVPWEETDEFKNNARKVIRDCTLFATDKPNPVIYGDYYNMIAPIKNSDNTCSGVIIFAFSDRILKAFKSDLQKIIFYISTLTLLVSVLVSYLVSKNFSKNINEMLEVVNKISLGDLSRRVQMRTNDEFELLAHNFNTMVDSLHENMITKTKLNEDLQIAIKKEEELSMSLEKKVIERTAAQEKAYAELKASQNQLIQSEKMAALGQLIAGIAHEINTPIGAIKASAGNIKVSLGDIQTITPVVFKSLEDDLIYKLNNFIDSIGENNEPLSTKDERKLRKELLKILESNDIPNSEDIAHLLTDLKVRELSNDVIELFRHPLNDKIVKYIYNFGGLRIKSTNIETSVDKTAKIVYALKSYSSKDTKGLKVKTDITQGIETVLIIYQNYLNQGIEVIKNFGDIPQIHVYPDELNQVWTNIIYNSIQAMKNKGQVSISTATKTLDSKEYISVCFVDSGPGIPETIKDKIFEPFFTTKNAGEGSGLGLHICKQIIDKHEGKISLTTLNAGAGFEVLLPVS